MSISEALLRGRGVYRRLFATEETGEDEYADDGAGQERFYRSPYPEESPRVNAAQALMLSGEEEAWDSGIYPGSQVFFSGEALPEDAGTDVMLERLMRRMESESRMYPQDFREE